MARDSHPTVNFSTFAGLDNRNKSYEMPNGALQIADNIDVTREGKIRRRKGQTQINADSYTSICNRCGVCLALDSTGVVHQLDDSLSSVATYSQLSGTGPNVKLNSLKVLDQGIFSNGIAAGMFNPFTMEEIPFDQTDWGDRTADLSDAPAFCDIENFAGRNYYACLEKVYYSQTFGYFKVRRGMDYFRFQDTITMIAQVDTGLFVSTLQATYFLAGRDPKQMELTQVDNRSAIEGTKTYVDGSLVGEGSTTEFLPVWATAGGFCIGLPTGEVIKATRKNVALPQGSIGSMMFREQDGQNHVVSVIQT